MSIRGSIVGAALGLAVLTCPAAVCAQSSRPAAASPTGDAAAAGLTLQQFQARRDGKMLAGDTDGDGRVGEAEFLAAANARKGDPAKRFAKLDRNRDGYLDKAEIDAGLARRFQRLDANRDGILSAQERAAARHEGGKADPGG